MDGYSLDLTRHGIDIIKKYFPDVITEGRIDFQRLQLALGEDLAVTDHYELTWAGKAQARREIQKRTTCTLHPDFDESVDFENSQNIYIEGENLEVLRILQNSYFGKVKVIYIDPPYNTGNDSFVYPDDYSERKAEYQLRTGRTDEEGFLNKFDLFRTNNGQLHSPWLSMMYPRLYMARNLLREDGVIFVSIDDHEAHNLKLLMDEIFGEENFVASIVWQKKYAVSNDDPGIAPMHDYILCFQKSEGFKRQLLPRTEKQLIRYKNTENDPRGPWSSDNYVSNKSKDERPTLWYPILHPKTGKEVWPDPSAVWRYSKIKHESMVKEDRLYWGPDFSYEKPRLKRFLSEIQDGLVPSTWWPFTEVGHNDEGQKETAELLGKKVFSTPKPKRLMKRILEIATGKDDIVLDFFSGSSTTAQATLELNSEDSGSRKFIMIQLAEPTIENGEAFTSGFKDVAAMGRERIRRVAKEMQTTAANSNDEALGLEAEIQALRLELDESSAITPELFNKVESSKATSKIQKKIDKLAQQAEDLRDKARRYEQVEKGFKAFKLGISNFKPWQKEGPFTDKQVHTMTLDFKDPVRSTAKSYPMLVEFMLKNGLPLTASVQEIDAAGVPVYTIDKNELWVLLDRYEDSVREVILQERPKRVVCLDRLFAGNDQLLTNLHLELRERNIELTVI